MDIDKKFFTYQFFVITAATVVSLYIYHNIIKKNQTQQNQTQQLHLLNNLSNRQMINMVNNQEDIEDIGIGNNEELPEPPKYKLEITTCELDSETNFWIPILTHTFYGNSQKDIDNLINSHRQTDSFFDASFTGRFNWKGGTVQLKNITSNIMYS